MTGVEFEKVLREIDPRFSVVENPNRIGLSNIFFTGLNYDLPVISTNDIKEEVDQGHRYQFPNGMFARFWSQGEVLERCKDFVKDFAKGQYSELYD